MKKIFSILGIFLAGSIFTIGVLRFIPTARADDSCIIDNNDLSLIYNLAFHRSPDSGADGYVGQNLDFTLVQLLASPENTYYSAVYNSVKTLEADQRDGDALFQINSIYGNISSAINNVSIWANPSSTVPLIYPISTSMNTASTTATTASASIVTTTTTPNTTTTIPATAATPTAVVSSIPQPCSLAEGNVICFTAGTGTLSSGVNELAKINISLWTSQDATLSQIPLTITNNGFTTIAANSLMIANDDYNLTSIFDNPEISPGATANINVTLPSTNVSSIPYSGDTFEIYLDAYFLPRDEPINDRFSISTKLTDPSDFQYEFDNNPNVVLDGTSLTDFPTNTVTISQ